MVREDRLFGKINRFFDHIYLITLKGSSERQARIEQALEGLNYQYFWGVDGRELDMEKIAHDGIYDPELTKQQYPVGRELVRGEIGCALSHLEVYKDIKNNGYGKALILEDDVSVEPDGLSNIDDSLSELPEDWDLLYFGCGGNHMNITLPVTLRIRIAYPILKFAGFKQYDANRLRCTYSRPYSKNLDLAGWHFGSYAYGVTASGADKILAYQTPISLASDNALGMMCIEESIKAFRIKERVFHYCTELTTTIEGRNRTRPRNKRKN